MFWTPAFAGVTIKETFYEATKSKLMILGNVPVDMKYRPYAFTELGILMLSSVLNDERAIET